MCRERGKPGQGFSTLSHSIALLSRKGVVVPLSYGEQLPCVFYLHSTGDEKTALLGTGSAVGFISGVTLRWWLGFWSPTSKEILQNLIGSTQTGETVNPLRKSLGMESGVYKEKGIIVVCFNTSDCYIGTVHVCVLLLIQW